MQLLTAEGLSLYLRFNRCRVAEDTNAIFWMRQLAAIEVSFHTAFINEQLER